MATCPKCGGYLGNHHRCRGNARRVLREVSLGVAGGIAGFGRQVTTQIAGVVGPTAETPQPTEAGLPAAPTAWPTLTPTESPTPENCSQTAF